MKTSGLDLSTELRYKVHRSSHNAHFQFIEEGPCWFSRKTNLQKQNKYWHCHITPETLKHRCAVLLALKSDKEYSDIIILVSGYVACCRATQVWPYRHMQCVFCLNGTKQTVFRNITVMSR